MTETTLTVGGRLAAVWFADIVGYTAFAARDHDGALALVDVFRTLVERSAAHHGGRLVKLIGDGALVEFASTTAALRAALELQREFQDQTRTAGRTFTLRVGVHLGEIEAAPDGDIYGDGVNTASRLQVEAEPGHVLVSDVVRRSLQSHSGFLFLPAGRRRLRGRTGTMAVYEARPAQGPAGAAESREGLMRLRGWRLVTAMAAYLVAGWLLLRGILAFVEAGALPAVLHQVVRIWWLGLLPVLLLLGWFHGYQRHRHASIVERSLIGLLGIVMLALTWSAFSRHNAQQQARTLAAVTGLDPRRVAVLFFESAGEEGASVAATGLTRDLIAQLSTVRALDVVSENGVARFRDGTIPPDSVARVLRAGSIVAGRIEQADDALRINVRLVDGASGADVRRAAMTVPADAVLDAGNQLATRVAGFLREWLGDEIRIRERRSATDNVAAWSLLHRADAIIAQARDALGAGDGHAALSAFEQADTLLTRAAALDPGWAEPHVLRGRIDYLTGRASGDAHEAAAALDAAAGHAEEALRVDANSAGALELRGTARYARSLLPVMGSGDERQRLLALARTDLEDAVRRDPARASAHATLSHLYYNYDLAAAVLAARRAWEEDAYLDVADAVVWRLYNGSLDLEQFEQARHWCAVGAERFPDDYYFTQCRLVLMATPAAQPDVDSAWQLLARIDTLADPQIRPWLQVHGELTVGGVLARAGLADSARAVLDRARDRSSFAIDPHQELLAYEAYLRTLLGDEDEARALLQRYAAANTDHLDAAGGATAWWWRTLRDRSWFREIFGG